MSQYSNKIFFNNIDRRPRLDKETAAMWLTEVARLEKKKLASLQYNFCSDGHLLEMNKNYLQHNTYTDIITFDLSDQKGLIDADIYISVDRVKENSKAFAEPVQKEFYRVLVHGLLHLCGYKDKSVKDAALMREKENYYLRTIIL